MGPSKSKLKSKKWRILAFIAVLAVAAITWNIFQSDDDGMDFTEMILNAETDMVSIAQEDQRTRKLLERFKPRVYIDKESYFPVDFYEEYLPNTTLKMSGTIDKLVSESVSRSQLNDLKYEKDYYLDYQLTEADLINPEIESYETSIYGRAYKSSLSNKEESIDLLFLKYTLVYPYSGLPAGTSNWKIAASNIIGDPMAWHELDIHGAIHIVLEETSMKPVGIILAQHNHHRVYMVKDDFDWPLDDHVNIAVAKYSNEPYLADLKGGSRLERTVGNPMAMDFLLGMEDKEPLTAGYDYIPSIQNEAIEIESKLIQLDLEDPLYRATMGLGDRKKILGVFSTFFMNGPPGADFYAMPSMIDLSELMAFWDIDINDEEYMNVYEKSSLSFMNFDATDLLDYQRAKLIKKLKAIIN